MSVRVAYLGPPGTHSEEALATATDRADQRLAAASVSAAADLVLEGSADRAVVPLENSLEGGVGATLDLLATRGGELQIVYETVLAIRHHLIAREGEGLADVRSVHSHPQALAQSQRFLDRRLPSAGRVAAASTAAAVEGLAIGQAAIGTELAAELYERTVLEHDIHDDDRNETRFAWLARSQDAVEPAAGALKTSIVFWGFNDVSPGSLVDVLSEFSRREINLTRIESRPRRVRLGHYMFFVDLEGDRRERGVADALTALSQKVQTLVVLGSYAACEAVGGRPDGR